MRLRTVIATVADRITGGEISKTVERAYYEGAKRTRLNADFDVSNNHFELQAGADREMLRARARWLAANNPITRSIDKSIMKNVVGSGIRVQSKVKPESYKKASDFNKEIEALWDEFIKKENCDITGRISLYGLQKMSLKHRITDGEVLINKVFTKDKRFPLKLQFIEADQLDTAIDRYEGNAVFGGVEVDGVGKVVAYHLKKEINSFGSQRVPAENIIHYYMPDRVTQYRGVSEYAAVINTMKDFSAYNDAEITGARARASFALFVETTNPKGSIFGDQEKGKQLGSNDPIKEVTAGMIKYLRPGEKVDKLQPNQVGTTYPDFVTTTIRMIAAGRDISYELAFRDYTKVNFSSSRSSLIQDNKRFDEDQASLIESIISPIYESFVDSMILAGRVKSAPKDYWDEKQKYVRPFFIPPKREWVDPLKDIKTLQAEYEMNMTTGTEMCAARGKDFYDTAEQKLQEELWVNERRKELGLEVNDA